MNELTKREFIAMQILSGMVGRSDASITQDTVNFAVEIADMLMQRLKETEE